MCVLVDLCGTDLKVQTGLAEVGEGTDRSRSPVPFNRFYFLVLITCESNVLAPEVETVGRAEIVVEALALAVCVAEVESRLSSPESSCASANLDGCANALEVFFLAPESVRLHFGGVAGCLTN